MNVLIKLHVGANIFLFYEFLNVELQSLTHIGWSLILLLGASRLHLIRFFLVNTVMFIL